MAALCAVLSFSAAAAPRTDVILWFDTEDYLSPRDDDACLRLATMLTERHIRATFKVVGEKARVLERRGRHDVIEALKQHDIGFHANFHSVHPTPTEYLKDCGLLDGIEEFRRREGPGAADVRRIFQKDTLVYYGQPGSSWAAQAIAALPAIGVAPKGVPCYVDEGEHVGLEHQPFWYAGAINVYHMGPNYTRMELHDPDAVEPAKQKVAEIVHRLQSDNGGGLVIIFYHPCEWIHQEFWDGVNFRRGSNPPPAQWQVPPQRSQAETDAAFERFGKYIDYIHSLPGVRFVTAGDLPLIYEDTLRTVAAPAADLKSIAQRLTDSFGKGGEFLVLGSRSYSLADQFELLAKALTDILSGKATVGPRVTTGLLGPDNLPPEGVLRTHLAGSEFQLALADVAGFIATEHRVPSRVFIGPDPVSPGAFLAAMAKAYSVYATTGQSPANSDLELPAAFEIRPAHHVAQDTPGLFGGWIIHKEGFRAPKVMEMARLQAWTLKPALRKPE